MDDEDYKPRSPDLSALGAFEPLAQQQYDGNSYSYSPTSKFFSLPSSSYYQPPLQQQHLSSPFDQNTYQPPLLYDTAPSTIKSDAEVGDEEWLLNSTAPNHVPTTKQGTAKPRKMSSKQQQQAAATAAIPPRPPAPGEEERLSIKTKFPVARIKRLVQADDEVGKVAQVTPPVVGKALELFMIQMTLAAIAEANARGSKRLTAAHVKAAISRDDKFDFLKDIGDKIAEGSGGKGDGKERKPKQEKMLSDGDDDVEGAPSRAKRRSGGKRRKISEADG